MKKFILFFFVASLLTTIQAQTLPNSTFETWEELTALNNQTYLQPVFWNTPNEYTVLTDGPVVTRSEEAFIGSYSARLETRNIYNGMFKAPGLLTLASFVVNISTFEYAFHNGIALSEKVLNLSGKYKYAGVSGDSAFVQIYCYKKEGDNYDTIGMGYSYLHNASDWSSFKVNMNYINDHQPDTFNVIIMSSPAESLKPGSVMFVDSMSIHTQVGVLELGMPTLTINCFPNPTTDHVVFEAAQPSAKRSIKFYDIQGKQLNEIAFPATSVEVSLVDYPAGTLLYRVMDPEKGTATGSVVKNPTR